MVEFLTETKREGSCNGGALSNYLLYIVDPSREIPSYQLI